MTKTLIQDIVTLTKDGWRPYNAQPEKSVYVGLGCEPFLRGRKKPFWFVRGDVFCCIGCGSHCTLTRPTGFPLPLPLPVIKYTRFDQPYSLTPLEMVHRRHLLTVKQAAYCLNVSERQVYDWLAEGRLIRLKENPVRVRATEVKAMMHDFDE